jgi:hypothetical protein
LVVVAGPLVRDLDTLCATASIAGYSASLLEDPYLQDVMKVMYPAGPNWTPPSRTVIVDIWLPELCTKTHNEVMERFIADLDPFLLSLMLSTTPSSRN